LRPQSQQLQSFDRADIWCRFHAELPSSRPYLAPFGPGAKWVLCLTKIDGYRRISKGMLGIGRGITPLWAPNFLL
jgi:hypothetical protein